MRRILIVDDDPGIVRLAKAVLARHDHAIRTARSGEEALALLAGEPADVVVLDVEMPGISGWDTLRAIRSDPRLAAVRVVIHSGAHLDRPTTGPWPDRILAKPVSPRTLLETVERVCLKSDHPVV